MCLSLKKEAYMESINTDTNKNNKGKSKKSVSENPDVNFGADEGGGSGGVEIDTAGLGDQHEIDLDRSGPSEGGGGEEGDKSRNLEAGQQKGFKKGSVFEPEGYSKSGGLSEEDTTGYY